jgi:molecular chaperone HtpG
VSTTATAETHGFQAEVRQLLQLMIHSLYSNRDIFLRELISNASDAADKLRFEALAAPELLGDDTELVIRVELDAGANTLTVADNGIGMSRNELIENLGTIARSGTAEFLKSMTGDARRDARLIGQFGAGFYSAFIVADRVVVETRHAGLGPEQAMRWSSDGQGEFSIETVERAGRGTQVTLHLKPDAREFTEPLRVENLIRRYSDHIGFPVTLRAAPTEEPRVVNSGTALWTRSRSDISDEEYREFYKHLAHDFSDPLRWSHNRVEGNREYTSLLYLPGRAPFDLWNRDAPRGLKLYVQRVFIMDDAEQFLPLYLRFVKGVVDCADLPLNVSRELLQQHPDLQSMRSALTRRVLDMLDKLSREEAWSSFWAGFGNVIKEGIVEDPSNRDRIAKLLRFSTTEDRSGTQSRSLADYVAAFAQGQDCIYYLIADNYGTALASPQLESLQSRGIEVLLLTDPVDPWIVTHLAEYDGKLLVDAGRDKLQLPGGDAELSREADAQTHKGFLKKLRRELASRAETVNISARLVDSAACVVAGEGELNPQLRRMLEASGQALPPAKPILEINPRHPLVERIAAETDEARFRELAGILLDHALIADGSSLDNPADYVRRMNRLIVELGAPETTSS